MELPGHDDWKTNGGENEPTPEVIDCEECGNPADARSVPLRGRYLCHGCAASLALSVLESVTESRIARIDAIQRLREFAAHHERCLRLDNRPAPLEQRMAEFGQRLDAHGRLLHDMAEEMRATWARTDALLAKGGK